MKVIVSGATGFIGFSLIDYLLKKGDITIYALIHDSQVDNLLFLKNPKIISVICDLENNNNNFSMIPSNIDVFYHFAWIGVKPEQRNDYQLQFRNIKLTMNCLFLAKEKKVKTFISPGSTNEYLYSGNLINKYSIPTPIDSYGTVKVALRYLQKQFLKEEGIQFIYVIIASIYSERRLDNNVITYTVKSLLNKTKPSLSKCEQLWDYVHIDDVVEALFLVYQHGKNESIYSIGHGDNWPLRNYIEIIHKVIDSNLPLGIGDIPYKNNELPSSCIDLTDIKQDTGFVPHVSFEQGILRMIKNMQNNCVKNGDRN